MQQGNIPQKRHITFKKEDGSLFREELFSTHGFSNIYCNKYHYNMPTKTLKVEGARIEHGAAWAEALINTYKVDSSLISSSGDLLTARRQFFYNDDVAVYTAKLTKPQTFFYKNAYADEVIFVHAGQGTLRTAFGSIAFSPWDYLILPRGTIYQLEFTDYQDVRLFIAESFSMLQIPKHYRNEYGQLLESAPYCERDIKTPSLEAPRIERGDFPLFIKFRERYQKTHLEWHPFDLEGWDGCAYPWAISIKDFCPVVGRIHLPPPVHLLLTGDHFVLCNFVPRLFDFHPEAIPAPYYHSNVDSDELLYYVDGDFMSRTGIKDGFMTLHPKGVPHGPQPGKTEASVGKKEVYEYAVMIDTFRPLCLTEHVKNSMTQDYERSWLE